MLLRMPRHKRINRSPELLPVVLDDQIPPDTFEFAPDDLVDHELDLSAPDAKVWLRPGRGADGPFGWPATVNVSGDDCMAYCGPCPASVISKLRLAQASTAPFIHSAIPRP